jgi:hypothetical protein
MVRGRKIMKTYNLNDIRQFNPCYDPARYAPEDWEGTLVDILKAEQIPPEDRLWVVTGLLDDKTNRLFAVWCAREALKLVDYLDPQSIKACDVAEKYANGLATSDELAAARAAAGDAARYAAWYAARDAARAAARDVARAADAAWDAARAAQLTHLIEMIEENNDH